MHVCAMNLLNPRQDPNDLSFQVGEIIEIVKETNADWWTGRNKAGKEGLFPSVYVEKLPPRSVSPLSSFPEFPKSRTSLDSNLKYGLTEPSIRALQALHSILPHNLGCSSTRRHPVLLQLVAICLLQAPLIIIHIL